MLRTWFEDMGGAHPPPPKIHHANLKDTGRAALMMDIRIASHAGDNPARWRGPHAEQEADQCLRHTAKRPPPGTWRWRVRLEVILDTSEPLTAYLVLDAGRPAPTVRQACIDYLTACIRDEGASMPHRIEAHRIAELLTGSVLPDPQRPITLNELLDLPKRKPDDVKPD